MKTPLTPIPPSISLPSFLKRRSRSLSRSDIKGIVRLPNDRRSRFGDDFRGEAVEEGGREGRLLIEYSKKAEG